MPLTLPGRATPPPTPGHRTPPEGETDPSPQREPEVPGHSPPGRQGGGNGDDSPSSSGDRENNGEGENSGDKENSGNGENNGNGQNSGNERNSGDGNSSEGNGSECNSQNGDSDDDDNEDKPRYSDLGAGSTPSSQRADASMEDQTSQAEELPVKSTGRMGTPATQPPAKGANKRKGKKPHRKFLGILPDKAQYTGPCLRERYGTRTWTERSQCCTFTLSTGRLQGRKPYKMWAIQTSHGNGHTRQEEWDAW